MDTQWLKDAQEHFREAMDKKDWDMAKAVIVDIQERHGFSIALSDMRAELRHEMDKAPSVPHGYILGFLRKKNEEYKAKGLVPTLDLLIEDLTN